MIACDASSGDTTAFSVGTRGVASFAGPPRLGWGRASAGIIIVAVAPIVLQGQSQLSGTATASSGAPGCNFGGVDPTIQTTKWSTDGCVIYASVLQSLCALHPSCYVAVRGGKRQIGRLLPAVAAGQPAAAAARLIRFITVYCFLTHVSISTTNTSASTPTLPPQPPFACKTSGGYRVRWDLKHVWKCLATHSAVAEFVGWPRANAVVKQGRKTTSLSSAKPGKLR